MNLAFGVFKFFHLTLKSQLKLSLIRKCSGHSLVISVFKYIRSVARERMGMRVQNSGTSPVPYLYCHRGSYKSIYVASVSYRGRRGIHPIGMGAAVRIT